MSLENDSNFFIVGNLNADIYMKRWKPKNVFLDGVTAAPLGLITYKMSYFLTILTLLATRSLCATASEA